MKTEAKENSANPMMNSAKTGKFNPAGKDEVLLHCFYQVDNHWQHKQFSPQSKAILIGSSSSNEIDLNSPDLDKTQVTINKVEEVLYVMECGKDDLMKINGIPKRQIIMQKDSTAVLQIQDDMLILCYTNKIENNSKKLRETPETEDFTLSLSPDYIYPFPNDKLCLIGANPSCNFSTGSSEFLSHISNPNEIKVFEKPLIAMIFRYNNQLLIQSFDDNILLNGEPFQTATVLIPESVISIGKSEIIVNTPPELSSDINTTLPSLAKATFCLMPLYDPYEIFSILEIPPSTRSLTVGRSTKRADFPVCQANISKEHAQLIIYPKSMMVYDTSSSNGTFVNGEKITKKTIKPGDTISFADVPFLFCYANE